MWVEKAPDASRKKRIDMDLKQTAARTVKLVGALTVIALFFVYVLQHSTLITVSPDSVRFMHFWQRNADQFTSDGRSAEGALKAVYYSFKASNAYDLNRGRLLQVLIYGIDAFTRWTLPSPMLNVWMMLVLLVNAAMVAWVSTSALRDADVRLNVFCLGWCVLMTSSVVISPVMLLILYGKYLWVTPVLAFFAARRPLIKAGWLAIAPFTDELGLFAMLGIVSLWVIQYVLASRERGASTRRSPLYCLARACCLGSLASLTVLFVFFGVMSVVLGVGADAFRGFVYGGAKQAALPTGGWWSVLHALLWQGEVMVLGLPLAHRVITTTIGTAVFATILAGVWKRGQAVPCSGMEEPSRLDDRIQEWLGDEKCFFYTFWMAMLLFVGLIVLPGRGLDLTHYSYPAAAVLAVLFITALVDVWPAKAIYVALVTVLAVHLSLLPRAMATTTKSLESYLFTDSSVTKEDISAIKRSVMELREQGHSAFFDTFNNGQEIDFSGRWFYSRVNATRVTAYGPAPGPYFPIQGTVRVLLWPARTGIASHKRVFDLKSPTFKDLE